MNMLKSDSISNRISATVCQTCGGPAPHWKCPKCNVEAVVFNPSHWRECKFGTKMQAKCEACNEAETNCSCRES